MIAVTVIVLTAAAILLMCGRSSNAQTYVADNGARVFGPCPETPLPPVLSCSYWVLNHTQGTDIVYPDMLTWPMQVALDDAIDVHMGCYLADGSWSGWSGPAENGPYISAPYKDPSGDGCWGIRDLGYIFRAGGAPMMTHIGRLRRLWQKCLTSRRTWE
jgi:hypothetical protein